MREKYVLDASMGIRFGLFCFCPVELDESGEITSVITGMTYLGPTPPGELIAIFHEDGNEAVEQFCRNHEAELEELKRGMELAKERQP